jgi:hypothetical protein
MAIEFTCECGKKMTAKAEWAGKKTRCPACNAAITIPVPKSAEPVKAEQKPAHDPMSDAIPVDFEMPAAGKPSAPAAVSVPTPEAGSGQIKLDAAVAGAISIAPVPDTGKGNHAYKVLMPKDYLLSTKFNAEGLEKTLNDYARQGWCVKATAVMSVPGAAGAHDELILILEH